jgi:hypothetical protein
MTAVGRPDECHHCHDAHENIDLHLAALVRAMPLLALTMLYCASVGAFSTLIGAPIIALGDSTDVGRHMGMYFTILPLGSESLVGSLIVLVSGTFNRLDIRSSKSMQVCSLSEPQMGLLSFIGQEMGSIVTVLTLVLVIHARLSGGYLGTPRPVRLSCTVLRTEESGGQSIEGKIRCLYSLFLASSLNLHRAR